jgi:hypothetical protein
MMNGFPRLIFESQTCTGWLVYVVKLNAETITCAPIMFQIHAIYYFSVRK